MSSINGNGTAAWQVYGDGPVPHSYSAAWIAFSYVISLIGTSTTIELLHRQTSSRGLYNWFLMIGASIAMGGVAIWSMHFIGNQAINMGDGSQSMRLVYSSSYTGISFILPILVVASSFLVFSVSHHLTWWNIIPGGVLAGAAIVGMHYVGEAGISNYYTTFSHGTVAGACLIAVFAATLSFGLFFRLKSHWSSVAWRRLLCAALLAFTISAMHWVAVVGTTYTAKQHFARDNGVSTKTAGWICGVLSLVCCLLLIIFMILWQHYIYRTRQKAREVTLAICIWDPDEKLMINAAGTVPSSRITRAYFDDVWEEEFQEGHPVFCWMYRVSRNWRSCVDLIPGMRSHIMHLKQAGTLDSERRDARSHTKIFREQFCVAAADLALRLDQPLENLGILYDRVITTGTSRRGGLTQILAPLSPSSPTSPTASIRDVESVLSRSTGRGQVLFLVKHATRQEASRLQASGYAFAPINSVIDSLARYGQVAVDELRPHLDSMIKYKLSFQALEPGVHLSVFCVKPNMYQSFNVLVDKQADNLLPAIRLRSLKKLERWQQDIISGFSDLKAKDLMKILPVQAADTERDIQQRQFLTELIIATGYLSNRIGPELLGESTLTAAPYQGPCATILDTEGNMTQATVFAFRLVTDLHSSQPPDAADEYIPFRLFASQQRCYANSPDHATFASLVHQEFSGVDGRCSSGSLSERRDSAGSQTFGKNFKSHFGIGLKKLNTGHSTPTRKQSVGSEDRCDNVSEKGLVRNPAPSPFGGILVSNQVSVSVTERESGSCGTTNNDNSISVAPVANAVEVAASSKENDCFADELLVHALRDHVMNQRTNQHKNMARVS